MVCRVCSTAPLLRLDSPLHRSRPLTSSLHSFTLSSHFSASSVFVSDFRQILILQSPMWQLVQLVQCSLIVFSFRIFFRNFLFVIVEIDNDVMCSSCSCSWCLPLAAASTPSVSTGWRCGDCNDCKSRGRSVVLIVQMTLNHKSLIVDPGNRTNNNNCKFT